MDEQEPVSRGKVQEDVLALLEWLDDDGLRALQNWVANAHEFYKGDPYEELGAPTDEELARWAAEDEAGLIPDDWDDYPEPWDDIDPTEY